MSQIGIKVESAEDLYAAVCESVKSELAKRDKPTDETPVEEESEKKPGNETALYITVRAGFGKTVCPRNVQSAVQLYLSLADNPSAHPFLLVSVEESSAQLVMNRRTDERHHLLLPQSIPAEMLLSREMYMAVTSICHKIPVVIHNTDGNEFFMKKLAEAQRISRTSSRSAMTRARCVSRYVKFSASIRKSSTASRKRRLRGRTIRSASA